MVAQKIKMKALKEKMASLEKANLELLAKKNQDSPLLPLSLRRRRNDEDGNLVHLIEQAASGLDVDLVCFFLSFFFLFFFPFFFLSFFLCNFGVAILDSFFLEGKYLKK